MPLLIQILGIEVWSKIILAQSLGIILSTLHDFGFSTLGSSMIAKSTRLNRQSIISEAFIIHVLAFPFIVVLSFFAESLFLKDVSTYALLIVLSNSILNFSNGWIYIGLGQDKKYLKRIIFPRTALALISLGVVYKFASPLIYSLCVIFSSLVMLSISMADRDVYNKEIFNSIRLNFKQVKHLQEILKANKMGIFNSVFPAVLLNSPIILVNLFSSKLTPDYAMCDRLLRFAFASFQPIGQILTKFVPSADRKVAELRIKTLLPIILGAMLVPILIFFALTSSASNFLSLGDIRISGIDSFILGISFALYFLCTIFSSVFIVAIRDHNRIPSAYLLGILTIFIAFRVVTPRNLTEALMCFNFSLMACFIYLFLILKEARLK